MLDRLVHLDFGRLDLARLELTEALSRVTGRYTASEVVAVLRGRRCASPPERVRAILACATQPSEWMWRLDGGTEWRLGLRLYYRLPTIVAWYLAGLTPDDVAVRISMFGGSASAVRALEAAARCIASRLNDGTLPHVRGAD